MYCTYCTKSQLILQTEAQTGFGAWGEKSQWPPLMEVMKFKVTVNYWLSFHWFYNLKPVECRKSIFFAIKQFTVSKIQRYIIICGMRGFITSEKITQLQQNAS
jgi:hypothetical protein